jgi:putative ABC transport system permease protein
MSLWSNLSSGLRALVQKRQTERDMDEELRGYLEAAVERKMRSGMTPAEARRAARVEMGSLESVKDEIRGAGWETAVEAFWRDLRYSVRVLAKAPVFTAVVVLTLALGIGANTAIFSLLDAILLRYLPVDKPEELVQVTPSSFTNPLWEQVRDRQDVFSGVFAWSPDRFNLTRGGAVQYANGLWVSGDYFRTLGLRPAAGRLLTTSDDRRGCPALAVLSHAFWEDHYGGAASAIGSAISLDGQPFEIAGVAPAGFYGLEIGTRFDVAIPICAATIFDGPKSRLDARSWWWLRVAGRRKPGIGMPRLIARLAALSPEIYGAVVPQNWDSKSQDNFRKRVLDALPAATGISRLRSQYEQPLHVLMAIVGLVLLIACANIASLLLARAAARGKEMALRQALGASRLRLVRQLLAECVLLSLGGALLGLLFARWGNLVLVRYLSTGRNTVFLDFSLDGRVLAFTAAIAILTGLLFGVAPAFRSTRVSLTAAIKEGHASQTGPRGRLRLWIVASQVALSLVLLVTAGLLLRSFQNLATLDIGFDRNQVLLVNVNLTKGNLPKAQYPIFFDEIETRLGALPGVVSAAHSWMTPLAGIEWNNNIVSDIPNPPAGDDALVYFNFVSPTYFETMRTPLVAGRNLGRSDTGTSPQVAVINQTLARKFFPGVNPVGRTFRVEGEARKLEPPVEVVGIVKDAKYEMVREDNYPTVFRPVTQVPESEARNFEIRTAAPLAVMAKAIQEAIAGVNREIPIEIHTLAAQVNDTMTRERLLAALSAFFGALALLLATIGLYGTLSYLVTERRVEFGIRMALGARARSILGLVMRDVLALLAAGIAAGIAISLATGRLLGTLLFGLAARDPATMAMGAGLLAAVSLAASYLAARRATKVDPMVALRHE